MRSPVFAFVISLAPSLLTTTLFAQTAFDAGFAIGQQGYQSTQDHKKINTEVERLVRRNAVGVRFALVR